MLEKNSTANSTATSYSFEQILGWIGRFTPQFKFRLMSMRRQYEMHAFDKIVRDSMEVFRALIFDFAKYEKGAPRARRVFQMIENEYANIPNEKVSCSAGCSACCRTFQKQITDDEADLLAAKVKTGEVPIDLDELLKQSTGSESEANRSALPCLFLDSHQRCRVYADRPAVCRKYYVTSPADNCSQPGAPVTPKIDLMPELIVSAAISLPDNGIDYMPRQLAKRLLSDERQV